MLAIALALLMVPVLHSQVVGFVERLPGYIAVVREQVLPYVVELADRVDLDLAGDARTAITDMAKDAVQFLGGIAGRAVSGGLAIFNLMSLLVITPIVAGRSGRSFFRSESNSPSAASCFLRRSNSNWSRPTPSSIAARTMSW